jgi:hypothetical protein
MKKPDLTLQEILSSVFKEKNNILNKRFIFNNAIFGGLDSKWIKVSLFLLPLFMYGAIFNKYSFEKLGIAQAIVFYIILLVFAMQIVMLVTYLNNKKVIKNASNEWEKYFPNIDFKMLISSGTTPYSDFKKYYTKALGDGLEADALVKRLNEDFSKMEEENSTLVDAMRRDKQRQKK